MNDRQRQDLLNDDEKRKVRALGASRSHDRSASCTHQVLVKVIDRLGMMTTVVTAEGPITCAEVLEAHYECQFCGQHVLQTANPQAQRAYDTYAEGAEKFGAVLQAFRGVAIALHDHKENNR